MALVNFDGDVDLEELADFEEYNIIPRPQELIDIQKKASGCKSKTREKLSSESPKRSIDIKESKLKEKRSDGKHEKKRVLKTKSLYVIPKRGKSTSKKRIGDEFENKFESLVQNAKNLIAKQKSESLKAVGVETKQSGNKDIQHLKIMGEAAVTPEQRFKVLDARDNAIRTRDAKQGDSKKSKVLGCCPDMCPEKERYSRIAKNCLSIFETKNIFDLNLTSRDADHHFMVKEYSRSSADQQEPLPHELRPVPVLMSTMDYLICNIMDISLDNVSLADWYDFIWNRTRSIRKDITQQQLCDIRCVDIIEKCVRFHIHCAEALSEEDTSTFDPKINNENLTKGLQTLKHMYHDLESRGIHCPNEAEFRAYDILLSLTEGETLRLVKDIRKDILKSPMVKSAFEAALAFKSSNYVKFFKIIKKANYLSSCILHRYILEARADALQIIVRAYSTPSSSSLYPTSNLVKDLIFENSLEASEFCRCYGLEANEDYINVERRQFSKSASGSSLSRSILLVESKRNKTLGEIINNGELSINPLDWYQPHDSFDERSVLKNISLDPPVLEKEEVEVQSFNDEVEMDDISVDEKLQVVDSEIPPSLSLVKSQHSKIQVPLTEASIKELVKERSHILNKLSKLHYDKLEEVKSATEKIVQKRKEKSSHSKSKSASKSHNSIMYSEDSNSLTQVTDLIQLPVGAQMHQENTVVTTVPAGLNNSKFSFTTSSKFCIPSTLKTVNDITVTNASEPVYKSVTSETVTAASGLFFRPPVQSAATLFHSTTPVLSQNSVFHTCATPSIVPKDIFVSKVAKQAKNLPPNSPLIVKNAEFNFATHVPPVVRELEPLEREENLLLATESKIKSRAEPFEIPELPVHCDSPCKNRTSDHIEHKIQSSIYGYNVPAIEDIPVDDLSADAFNDIKSISDEFEDDLDEMSEIRREEELNELAEDLLDEIYETCAVSICKEVLIQEKRRMAALENEHEIIRGNLMRKVIIKWKYFCERRRQRRQFENSACCSPWQAMLLNTYVNTGVATPIVVYRKQCALSRMADEKIKKKGEILAGCEEFKPEEIWKLAKCKPYPASYFGNSGIVQFFKLCLVFPAECDNSDFSIFTNWICTKLSLPKNLDVESNCCKTFFLDNGKTVISVESILLGSKLVSKYKEFLNGISGMILCVPSFSNLKVKNIFFQDFTSLLESDVLMNPYPLSTFFVGSQNDSAGILPFLNEKLDAVYFTDIKTNFLSDVKDFCKNSKEVFENINWLIEKKSSFPLLQQCDCKYYLEDAFTFAFNVLYCKVSLDEFKHLKQMPQHIIDFYNKVLKFRSSALYSDLLIRISSSWPPKNINKIHPDFKYIDKQTQLKWKEKMKQVLLPSFEGDPNYSESVWQYVEDIAVRTCTDREMLIIRIKSALGISNLSPDWLAILNICALHLIYSLDFGFFNPSDSLRVYYTKEDLETFEADEFWQNVSTGIRKTLLTTAKRKQESVLNTPTKKQKSDIVFEDLVCDSMPFEKLNYFSNVFDVPDVFSYHRKNLFNTLEIAVAEQKKQSDAFLHYLDESIISGNALNGNKFDHCENENSSERINNSDDDISFPRFSASKSTGSHFCTGIDWIDNTVLNKSSCENSFSSIADKLSELRYNIQKSSILEDHFSQLLSKQV